MPLYATPSVQNELKTRFGYAFEEQPYPGAPVLELMSISKDALIEIGDFKIQPIEVLHGVGQPVLGFRFNDLVYITDCKSIEKNEMDKIKGTRILVINALHHTPHHSHLNLEEALKIIEEIKPERAYLTHISHNMGKMKDVIKTLPTGVSLAYDRLKLEF